MSLFALFYMIFAYLLGSISSAILICKVAGLPDPRKNGSHNPGATNVLRIGGRWAALAVLICDILKGMFPVWAGYYLGLTQFALGMVALGACLGHIFPIFFQFKGGKGVLVGVSVFLGIDWKVFLCLIVIFAVVLAISKYVSLGSIIAAACCPVVTFLFQFWQRGDLPMWYLWLNTGLAALMGAWVIYMHRTNIQRLKAGNENKFSFHSKKA